jgi:ABC-type transporter Mla subunit MlaD
MRARGSKRIPNWAIGLIILVVLAVASYAAFTKSVPWGGGTEVTAYFNSAQNLRPNSPVRIAGVEVGKVTKVEPIDPDSQEGEEEAATGSVPTGAVVTMELDDDGLPLKEDAQFTLKPRLFLEGNLFVDLQPGSPSSPTIDPDDHSFPPSQTANTVQLDQILTGSLQADSRKQLQVFLDQFGTALVDSGGAQSLRTLNKVSPGAFRYTSEVNQALLGENPHDLSELIVNLDRVVRSLNADGPALADLITNLRVTTGSFADQSVPLEAAIQELPNTIEAGNTAFASLNSAFPATRAFAREILPGVETAPATLDAATPLLRQLKLLSRPQELRGLVSDLRPTVPKLAKLTRETIPFLKQARALSSCFNNVVIPWANDRVTGGAEYDSQHGPKGRIFEETGYGLAGIAGESRSGDANGQYIRVAAGGGTNTVVTSDETPGGTPLAGLTPFPLDGAMPPLSASAKTPYKPTAPCENQDPPNLASVQGAPPTQMSTPTTLPTSGTAADMITDSTEALTSAALAAQAAEGDDKKKARRLEAEAMDNMLDFYESYGG